MKINKPKIVISLFCSLFLLATVSGLADTETPKANLPVLTTSAGQSADVETLNVICEEAGVTYDYCDVPTVELIQAGVGLADKESGPGFHVEVNTDLAAYPKGTPYETIIFAIGASLKGMGASGLTVDDEVNRLKKIIDYCKDKNISIIAVHAAGTSGRGAPGSDNERMIDAVAPFADYIIVVADSNKDGRFTTIAQDKGVPLTEVEYALEIVDIFKQVFK
jgi:ribosomal protein L7Ae-like RNA K-turn-binding protein